MNWLALKISNPKKFNELDTKWRSENKDYLRQYNTKHRFWNRWYRRKVDKYIVLLCAKKHWKLTQINIGRVFAQASTLARKAEIQARKK